MEQNREPRNRPKYSQLIFHKGAKAIQWRMTLFSNIGTGTTGDPYVKIVNLDTNFIAFTKMNSKCIIELSVKCKIIKLLQDKIESLSNLWVCDDFLYKTPEAQSMKEKKW